MTFLLFLAQNWKDIPCINCTTAIIGNAAYNNLTNTQIEKLISILTTN
jgi:hypothetical protein